MHDSLWRSMNSNSFFGLHAGATHAEVEAIFGPLVLREHPRTSDLFADIGPILAVFDSERHLRHFALNFARIPRDAVEHSFAGHTLSLDGLRFHLGVDEIEERLNEEYRRFVRKEHGKRWDDQCITLTLDSGAQFECWYTDVIAGLWHVRLCGSKTAT